MHTHCSCEHQLKHCSHCDLVYCEKCGKEWKTSYFSVGGSTTTWPPYATFTAGEVQLDNCSHK